MICRCHHSELVLLRLSRPPKVQPPNSRFQINLLKVPMAARTFRRVIAMPNLKPPITTTAAALAYRKRILSHVPKEFPGFQPLMTLYLTYVCTNVYWTLVDGGRDSWQHFVPLLLTRDDTPPEEIRKAHETGFVKAVKLYPAGATTNSANGVTDFTKVGPTLKAMEEARRKLVTWPYILIRCCSFFLFIFHIVAKHCSYNTYVQENLGGHATAGSWRGCNHAYPFALFSILYLLLLTWYTNHIYKGNNSFCGYIWSRSTVHRGMCYFLCMWFGLGLGVIVGAVSCNTLPLHYPYVFTLAHVRIYVFVCMV